MRICISGRTIYPKLSFTKTCKTIIFSDFQQTFLSLDYQFLWIRSLIIISFLGVKLTLKKLYKMNFKFDQDHKTVILYRNFNCEVILFELYRRFSILI
ncbi:hypothetical protein E4413_06825 [Leptospira interrogans]|nr:hypothetical protein C5473_05325 [Leptospira interrogans serovar Weerasinghe]KAA1291883.1 hypothetical protein C4X99_17475 [Leptospira interrogans serovar Geyaweera]OOB93314.1 hypothetical protein B0191_17635 [Leptospira interrogans serovar Hardjo]OOB94414.1 hypothetical protein B0192_21080 [Leptospira interrogans serovar Australis]QCO37813.1 hypothetical protein E4412_11805 [Leptospira interrogans]QOI34042.1 hypothetical protein LeptoLang_07340 [Leptospira interrogans serovar Icterohaemorr